jgi:hypothetical protein
LSLALKLRLLAVQFLDALLHLLFFFLQFLLIFNLLLGLVGQLFHQLTNFGLILGTEITQPGYTAG